MLTEEHIREYVNSETLKLNLEHHYWLKDNFLDKLGKMAPSLRELSLRRMKISNRAFSAIAIELKNLELIDICDCFSIQESSIHNLLDNNKNL